MTCIVGINTGKKIIIAGDRMGSDGFTHGQYQSKVFKKDDFIFGICGSYRVMQLLQYKFNAPKRFMGQSINDYLFTSFTDSIIQLMRDNNCALKKDNLDSIPANFLVGYEGKLLLMEGNFQLLESKKGYDSCGSGSYHAIASLYSTDGLDMSHEDRLKKAIVCASEFVLSVDNEIDIVESVYDKTKSKGKKPKPLNYDTGGIQTKGVKR